MTRRLLEFTYTEVSKLIMVKALRLVSPRFHRPIARSLTLGLLTCLGVLASVSHPSANTTQFLSVGQPVQAQSSVQATSLDNTIIRSYALSVLDIENIRQQRSADIAAMLSVDTLPSISCNNPDSIRGMDRDVREVVVEFCSSSIEIVEGHSLSIDQFNTITEMMNSNADLRDRIQTELINLQTNLPTNSSVNER